MEVRAGRRDRRSRLGVGRGAPLPGSHRHRLGGRPRLRPLLAHRHLRAQGRPVAGRLVAGDPDPGGRLKPGFRERPLRVMLDRLPGPMRRWLYAGGTRRDRLRDPDTVVAALDVRPSMVVGDLGPGYGHFTLRLARAVEPAGRVYALDASQSTLDDLVRAADDRG